MPHQMHQEFCFGHARRCGQLPKRTLTAMSYVPESISSRLLMHGICVMCLMCVWLWAYKRAKLGDVWLA